MLFEHGFEFEIYFKWALHYLHELIHKALQTRLIISSMLLFAKTLHMAVTMLWCSKVKADAILFREIQCKKMDNLMFLQHFQCELCWNKVKYARITDTHVCFIALTPVRSLGRCFKTRPIGLVFKQLPQDLANVNAWKNICDPYILVKIISHTCLKLSNKQNSMFKSCGSHAVWIWV